MLRVLKFVLILALVHFTGVFEPVLAASSAEETVGSENLAPVLPPERFFGAAAMGYAAAKAVPHTCSKIFCYCGCDITDNHNSLLDCFTSYHGVDCHICQEEALMALHMDREGKPLAIIQKAIDEKYADMYPFKDVSPALKKYNSTRLWTQSPVKASIKGKGDGTCCSGEQAAVAKESCCGPKK